LFETRNKASDVEIIAEWPTRSAFASAISGNRAEKISFPILKKKIGGWQKLKNDNEIFSALGEPF